MKYIRTWIAAVACFFAFAATRASAQQLPIAVQHIYFSLFNDYEDPRILTNADLVKEYVLVRTAAVVSGNVYRAVLYQLGPDWTNSAGLQIVREINLTNGHEGIYMRGFGRQTNISQYFTNEAGACYLDDFTSQATNAFPAINYNFTPSFPVTRANIAYPVAGGPGFTNILRRENMFFISFNTTNLKFNLAAYGTLVSHPVRGRFMPGGFIYSNNVDTFIAHGIGTMYRTGGSNVFYRPGVPPATNTGPIYGTFWTGEPVFMALTNGPE